MSHISNPSAHSFENSVKTIGHYSEKARELISQSMLVPPEAAEVLLRESLINVASVAPLVYQIFPQDEKSVNSNYSDKNYLIGVFNNIERMLRDYKEPNNLPNARELLSEILKFYGSLHSTKDSRNY